MIDQQRVAESEQQRTGAADPKELTEAAIAFWGEPTLSNRNLDCARLLREGRRRDSATRIVGARAVPTLALNALRALVVATSPDYHDMLRPAAIDRSCSCEGFTRAEMLRRGAAPAGRGLPAIEPGMPPRRHGPVAARLPLASAGLALSVYGAGRLLDPAAFEEGIAAPPKGPTADPGQRLPAGRHRRDVRALPGRRPYYTKYRPVLALPEDAGTVFTEDPRLHWHPQRLRWRSCTKRAR